MRGYFIWNGTDCRGKGVYLSSQPPILRGEERVEHVAIPGRAGELTITEGDDIYNSYIHTLTITVQSGARVREILAWLRGSGWLTTSAEPDRRQHARVIGAVTLDKVSRNLDFYQGEVQFYCDPFKEPLYPVTVTITSSGSNVSNTGDVTSRPIITMRASATSATVTAGGKTLSLTGLTSGTEYVIDCDAEAVTNTAGTIVYTANTSGAFPVLNPGANAVTGSGWNRLIIDRRERFL